VGADLSLKADIILKNGYVWTVDAQLPKAQAVAIRGNEILAVGSDEDVETFIGPGSKVLNMDGRLVLLVIKGYLDGRPRILLP